LKFNQESIFGAELLQSIFGLQLSPPLVYIAVFVVILLLLAIFAWVLRKISGHNAQVEGSVRGRQPRLGIVDTFQLDRQRQLVIIHRDSVEHLLLLGGTNDIVVENSIVRSIASQTQSRETGGVARIAAPPQPASPVKSAGTVDTTATNALSFATETTFQSAPAISSEMISASVVPKTSDLAEIASRFQTAGTKPIIAEHEASMPAASTNSFMPRPRPPLSAEEPEVTSPSQPESEAIIPAMERMIPPMETAEKSPELTTQAIPARDIGSLNDTLRQLLGRTREN